MKIKTISVTYGRKANLAWGPDWHMGQYESLHVEETIWADLDENDNEVACEAALRKQAAENVADTMRPILAVRDEKRAKIAAQAHDAVSMVGK